eukprot:5198530-Pyramimonas_sp.AAC.1
MPTQTMTMCCQVTTTEPTLRERHGAANVGRRRPPRPAGKREWAGTPCLVPSWNAAPSGLAIVQPGRQDEKSLNPSTGD